MDKIIEFAKSTILGISITQLGIAFLFILGGYLLRFILLSGIKKVLIYAERSNHDFDDVFLTAIHKPVGFAAVLAGIWLAVGVLPLPEEPVNVARFAHALMKTGFVIIAMWLGIRLTDGIAKILLRKAEKTPSPLDDQLVPVARNTLKVFLIVIGAVIILQDLGYSVSSLLAGLGLGGMALALASKDTLANLFGSMVIFIDRPFHIGDWIEMGEVEGTVEEVGLRVTRIRTFANSLITLPNSSLTTTAINNWSRMKKRRIKLTLGVTYNSSPQEVEKAVQSIRQIIRDDPKMDHDFFMVNFTNFGAYSLDIFVYCFTVTTDWKEYMDVRQALLLKFMDAVSKLGLEFAFPTQTLYHANTQGSKKLPGEPDAMQRDLPV
ncbi:MAG: mechanosensitive ion channel family protein [Candidatus Electryonea clarkiae]|nr:mechanosensitive ion channel family protein [Candidatus Electryonea clarkiae]MDP8286976.1 mechanosensitive ion channel family protein [Candidatus Electryonea clarkiae]